MKVVMYTSIQIPTVIKSNLRKQKYTVCPIKHIIYHVNNVLSYFSSYTDSKLKLRTAGELAQPEDSLVVQP